MDPRRPRMTLDYDYMNTRQMNGIQDTQSTMEVFSGPGYPILSRWS